MAVALSMHLASAAHAGETEIRRALSERLQGMPAIDEIKRSAVPGLYEVRVGTSIFYTDEVGNYLIQGQVIETRTQVNLTQARIDKLTAFDMKSLDLRDTVAWKQGTGARRLVIFADPNCGYCKRLERDLQSLKDVTVHTYLFPVLGPDSTVKARGIWCARDRTLAWRKWMLEGVAPDAAKQPCDASAIDRAVALGNRHKVTGTPVIVFEDGSRAPGALPAHELERRLAAVQK